MTLAILAKQISSIDDAIGIVDRARRNADICRLMDERNALSSNASQLKPRTHDDIVFLCDLIAEYAAFVADEPASQLDRDDALEAIARMTTNLKQRDAT